jgi:hypothetical protein
MELLVIISIVLLFMLIFVSVKEMQLKTKYKALEKELEDAVSTLENVLIVYSNKIKKLEKSLGTTLRLKRKPGRPRKLKS